MTYTGQIRRLEDGTLEWAIQDRLGATIHGTAVKDGAVYRMEGRLGALPEWLRLPMVECDA